MYIWGMETMIEKNFLEWKKRKEYLAGTLTPIESAARADHMLTTKAFHKAAK